MAQLGRMAVQFAGVVLLSRLLLPEDFGLVAMVAVFLSLGDLIRDFGLSSIALQAKELSHQQSSNLFWTSWALGAAAGAALLSASPLVVAAYDEPRLAQIVPVMALNLFLGGAQAQFQVELARQLKFSWLALSLFLAPALGLVLAIVTAYVGWGYWALVLQVTGTASFLLILQGIGARWLPSRPRRGHETRDLLLSGAQMGGTNLLTWAANNIDSLLAGVRWGPTNLGYYNRSFQLTATLVGGFLSPLTQVAIPMLNEARKAGRRPADLLVKMQFLVVAPISLLMVILALTAPSLIPLVLGEAWAPAIPLVQILAIAECVHSLSFISYWGFLTERLSKQLLYYNLVTKPLSMVAAVIGSSWGIEGIAWGYLVGLALSWPVNLLWLTRTAGFRGMRFLVNGSRVLGTAIATYGICRLFFGRAVDEGGSWLVVFSAAVCAAGVFLALIAVFPMGRQDLARTARVLRDFAR